MEKSELSQIVNEVIKRLDSSGDLSKIVANSKASASCNCSDGVFNDVNSAVEAAGKAQKPFQELGLEARNKIIRAIRRAALENAQRWAEMAVAETGMGRVADKVEKNRICAVKTPGVEDIASRCFTGDKGLTLVEFAPFGVVAAVTPSTNPVATIINNAIIILAAGNSVVFSPHPAAKKCVADAVRIINRAIMEAGAPANVVTTLAEPTQETTKELLMHPGANMTLVTGGPAIVKIAMTAGKTCKVIAAGPGNPPIIVDETAKFPDCAQNIITGAGFDNNVLCIAEKEIIVLEAAREKFLNAMRSDPRAYELNKEQFDALTKQAIDMGDGKGEPKVNRKFVGKNPSVIAKSIGLNLSDDIRVLWSVTPNDHPFVWAEQLMPVLPVTFVPNFDAALDLAYRAEGHNHHTAGIYSMNIEALTKASHKMACSIFVKNAPTIFGLGMGEGYAGMSIGTPTGDGITKPSDFVRRIHCAVVGYFRIA